jgi:hypothetical protein
MGRRAMRLLHDRITDPGNAAGPELIVLPVTVQGHIRVIGAKDAADRRVERRVP